MSASARLDEAPLGALGSLLERIGTSGRSGRQAGPGVRYAPHDGLEPQPRATPGDAAPGPRLSPRVLQGPQADRMTETAGSVDVETRFRGLVSSHRERAVRLAWRLLGGDEAAAEDVTQEAFISAYRAMDRFRGQSSLETWFYRILVRKAYSHIRWRKVRERFGRVDPDAAASPIPEPERDPVLRQRLAEALEALPRTQRDAFVLVHLEGFTVQETAEIMKKAPGTIKSHLHRALRKLREQFADDFEARERSEDDA